MLLSDRVGLKEVVKNNPDIKCGASSTRNPGGYFFSNEAQKRNIAGLTANGLCFFTQVKN